MKYLIGINGKKRSGKDTTYSIIASLLPGVQRAAFADKLKILGAKTLGYDGSDADLIALMDQFKERGVIMANSRSEIDPQGHGGAGFWNEKPGPGSYITGREYLQNLGKHVRDQFGDTIWMDQVLPAAGNGESTVSIERQLRERYPGVECLVITDVRYPNEARRVHSCGGMVWEIVRPATESDDSHDSEKPLPRDLIDLTIHNDGTLGDLAWCVDCAVKTLC